MEQAGTLKAHEEEEALDDEEEKCASFVDGIRGDRVLVEANRVVNREKQDRADEQVERQLDNDLSEKPRLPRVGLRRSFSRLIERALSSELRHNLLYQVAENGQQLQACMSMSDIWDDSVG